MESIIRNRKKVYSVGNILTQTEINVSCMLENYEKCMHRVEVVHTYDNQDESRFFFIIKKVKVFKLKKHSNSQIKDKESV